MSFIEEIKKDCRGLSDVEKVAYLEEIRVAKQLEDQQTDMSFFISALEMCLAYLPRGDEYEQRRRLAIEDYKRIRGYN